MQASHDEALNRRVTALRATGLLDSRREGRFDRLTRLVAAALGVPVAAISLVDAERQFFKSAIGGSDAIQDRRETPLSHSFCRHVVESEAPLIVEDSRNNPIVSGNPAIDELGVAAYLGVPIADRDGIVIGSLCAIENSPRVWAKADIDILTDVATLVQREIADRRDADTLAESEQNTRAILNTMPQLVWATLPDGRAQGFNNRWHEFTGSSSGDDDIHGWEEYCHHEDRAEALAAWRRALATEHNFDASFRLRRHDGSYRWMLSRAAPLRSPSGAIEMWFGSCTDIQVQRDLQESNTTLKRELAGGLIDRLSEKAAYAKGKEFEDIRGLIRSLRELGGIAA